MPHARLEKQDIEGVAGFLAFMATRVPRSLRVAQEFGEALAVKNARELGEKPDDIERILKALREQGKIDAEFTVEETQKILQSADKDFKFAMHEKPAMLMSLIMTEEVHRLLLEMNWCLCRAPSNSHFICSDSPLVCFVLDSEGMAAFGGGYSLPSVEVTFPISPEKCLYLNRKRTQQYRAVGQDFVKEINRRTAWAAERFIITTYKSEQLKIICEWASRTAGLQKIDKSEVIRGSQ